MRVLVACESSGAVREAFRARGHDAWSADLQPADDGSPYHLQGDVREHLGAGWDLMIAHPPCTYLSVSGMHWTVRGLRDPQLTEDALAFVRLLMAAPIPRIAIENPVSVIGSRIRKADQTIQPYQFGHDASKATCLWLKNLPRLRPTGYVEPRLVDGKPRWANQTDSGQNREPPSADRWKKRSKTFDGIAEAIAAQWGVLPRMVGRAGIEPATSSMSVRRSTDDLTAHGVSAGSVYDQDPHPSRAAEDRDIPCQG